MDKFLLMSPAGMKLLPHTQSTLIPLLLIVESNWHTFLLGKTLWLVSDIYPMRSGKQFVNTLEDNIHRHGAMDKLISDSTKRRSPTRSRTYSGPTSSVIGSLNHTIRIKTLLNGGIELTEFQPKRTLSNSNPNG